MVFSHPQIVHPSCPIFPTHQEKKDDVFSQVSNYQDDEPKIAGIFDSKENTTPIFYIGEVGKPNPKIYFLVNLQGTPDNNGIPNF